MQNSQKQFTGIDLHSICRAVADQQKLPEAFICYLLFEKLYAFAPRRAIIFLVESELIGFLLRTKGQFELIPSGGYELFQFEDGSTIAPEGADMTWDKFFELAYIGRSEAQIDRVDGLLTEHLETVI